MPSQYQVNISMSGPTVQALASNKFSLYGFKPVQASSAARPTVWFQTNDFSLTTNISWTESYQAYTSLSQIIPNGTIVAEAAYDADLGQTLTVSNPMGIGEVVAGTPNQQGIYILNQTSTPFTCGLSQQQPSGAYTPICAFNLFGHNMDVVVPIEQVFFMFSSVELNTGAVIEQGYGPGLLVNLTGANTQSVSYDINAGWSWADSASWAQSYLPNESLVPILIQPVASLTAP
jgi:hypothetical protein